MSGNGTLRLGDLPSEIHAEFQDRMMSWGVDPEVAEKKTTEEFRRGVSHRYREAVLTGLRPLGGDMLAIGEKLHMHRTTTWRWERDAVKLDWDNLLLAATAYRLSWNGVFPSASDALMAGVCQAMAALRRDVLGRPPLPCDPGDVYLVWYIAGNPRVKLALIRNELRPGSPLLREINSFVSQRLQRPQVWDDLSVRERFGEWLDAYLLFHVLIEFRWEV